MQVGRRARRGRPGGGAGDDDGPGSARGRARPRVRATAAAAAAASLPIARVVFFRSPARGSLARAATRPRAGEGLRGRARRALRDRERAPGLGWTVHARRRAARAARAARGSARGARARPLRARARSRGWGPSPAQRVPPRSRAGGGGGAAGAPPMSARGGGRGGRVRSRAHAGARARCQPLGGVRVALSAPARRGARTDGGELTRATCRRRRRHPLAAPRLPNTDLRQDPHG